MMTFVRAYSKINPAQVPKRANPSNLRLQCGRGQSAEEVGRWVGQILVLVANIHPRIMNAEVE